MDDQGIKKKLVLWQVILLGLAFMAPGLSLLATFNLVIVAGYTWTAVPLAYLLAGIAVIITAISFANLSKVTPQGGSVWTYAKDTIGPKFGQFSVWIYLLQLLVVPAAALIPVGFFANEWLGLSPWVTILLAIVLIMIITILGIELSFKTMAVLFSGQLIILLAFAASSIYWSINTGTFQNMASISLTPSGSLFGIAGIIVGAAAAVYSFLGFESSATMAEETNSPTKTIPKAIVITAIVGTLMITLLAWAFVLSIPTKGLFSLLHYINPLPAMAGVLWENIPPFYSGWQHILNIGGIFAGVTAAMAAVIATSRLLLKLGQENVLPSVFKQVSKKRATPVAAILFVGILGVILGQFAPWESIAYTIATGAVPTFIIVNFLAFWRYRNEEWSIKNFLLQKLVPCIGIALLSWILIAGLPTRMKMILLIWVSLGALLVFINACFRPWVFSKSGMESGTVQRVPSASWLGLALSSLALVISLVVSGIWLNYYGGAIAWWHILAPYASNNLLASVISLAVVLAFIVAMLLHVRLYSTTVVDQSIGGEVK